MDTFTRNISESTTSLSAHNRLLVRQRHEIAELFGYETRNKYEVIDETGQQVAWAAEQQKGIFGFLARQLLGHWRRFTIQIFNVQKSPILTANHPFRFIFQRLEVFDNRGRFIGAVQQRFSILTKRFDVQNSSGLVLFEIASPIWKIWTFPFVQRGRTIANVSKKWSGALTEFFTDKDNFLVEYLDPSLREEERQLILAAALFIDLQYFERKAKS